MANKSGIRLSNDDWHSLVGRIYDAAADPTVWGALLLDIGKPIHAHATQLVSVATDEAGTLDDIYIGHDVDEGLREFDELVKENQHVRVNFVASVPEMTTVYDYMHTSERDMKNDICYQEHLIPRKVPYYVATPLISSPDQFTAVGHFRRRRYGHFTNTEIDYIARLAPHLRRSLDLSRRLTEKGMIAGIEALLKALNCPAAVVDQSLQVVASNEPFLSIAKANDGIAVLQFQLEFSDSTCRTSLKRELKTALSRGHLADARGDGRISAKRKSGRKSYQVFVLPLQRKVTLRSRRLCLLLIIDPDDARRVPVSLLGEAFGLTRAEAEVASLLALGYDVAQIARLRKASRETVRSQIKSALRKSGTRRQAELVAAICKLCPSPFTA